MKTIDHRVMCFEVSVGRSGHLIKRFRYANQSACYDQSDHEAPACEPPIAPNLGATCSPYSFKVWCERRHANYSGRSTIAHMDLDLPVVGVGAGKHRGLTSPGAACRLQPAQ